MSQEPNENRLPGFLIIGAMKAGTTTLFHDLKAQEGVFIPADKEPHTLVKFQEHTTARTEYGRLLAGASSHDLCGDASTGYSKLPDCSGVAERARELLGPDLRILYLVRNPVDRILSHHHHAVTEGSFSGSLDEAIDELPCLVNYSCYGTQLTPWLAAFGPERVLVIVFEDYVKDRRGGAREVCRFLGVPFDPDRVEDIAFNASDGKPRVAGSLRQAQFLWPYRRLIRPLISPGLRVWLVRTFVPKAKGRVRQMPRRTYDRIAERLAADEALLSEQTGLPRPIFSPLDFVEDPPPGTSTAAN